MPLFIFCPNTKRRKPPSLPEVLLVFQTTEMRLTASFAEALWKNVLVHWELQFIHNVNQGKILMFYDGNKTWFAAWSVRGHCFWRLWLYLREWWCSFYTHGWQSPLLFLEVTATAQEKVTVLCVIQMYEHKNIQLYIFKCTVILFENALST